MSELVTREVREGVAVITLNRPERMNAINTAMGAALDAALVEAALDPEVRVLVITGAGDRAFCAGADVDRLEGLAPGGAEKLTATPQSGGDPVFARLVDAPAHLLARYTLPMAIPQPVIAAVNGACAGVGLALATHCDIRFASRTAFFTAGFPQRGLTAEAGLAKSLSALVGRGAASDLLLSGRKFTAEEAYRLGYVNGVLEPDRLLPHAIDYAAEMARTTSPRSTRVIKRQLRLALDQTLEEALNLSHAELLSSLASEDFKEGVASYKARRPPQFTGR